MPDQNVTPTHQAMGFSIAAIVLATSVLAHVSLLRR
jgi:hypothetical protein